MAVAAKVEQAGQAMLPIPHYLGYSEHLVHSERHWGELRSALTSCAPAVDTAAPRLALDVTEDAVCRPEEVVPSLQVELQGGAPSKHCCTR